MALPPELATVVLSGRETRPGQGGTVEPLIGRITFTPDVPQILHIASGTHITGTVTAEPDGLGNFTATLLAPDADGITPTGWTYQVEMDFFGVPDPEIFHITLSKNTPSVNLADLIPVGPTTGNVTGPATVEGDLHVTGNFTVGGVPPGVIDARPHAATHATGGTDPLTPAAIGALPATGGTVSGSLAVTTTLTVGGRVVGSPSIQVAAPSGVAVTDLASVNAAIAQLPTTGGELLLQAGTYVLPAPGSPSAGCLTLGVNNSVLRGMGIGVTVIQLAPGSAGVTGIVRTPSGVANSKIEFRDFSIDGNAANQTGSPTVIGFFCGVTPNSTATDTDIRCENVEIYGCTGYGFDPHERTTRLVLKNCISHDNGSDGLHDGFTLDGCYDSIVEGCVAYNNGRHGFNLVTASNNVTLSACKSYNNGGNGYTLQNGAKNNSVENCTAGNNTLDGIYVNGVPQTGQQDNTPGVNNAIKGNTIRLSGAHGIHLVGASHNHITSNTVRDSSQTTTNTSNQIYFDESGTTYSTYNTVADNDLDVTAGVTNAPKYGIRDKSTNEDNNFVFGNRSQGAVTAQISLLGATSVRLAAHNGVNEHPATAPYVQDTPAQHGLVEWNFQPSAAGATSTVTAGKVYLSRITVQTGGTLSNLVINITTAGAGLTPSYVAIFDNTGAQLAVSADISSLLTGTGGTALAFPAHAFSPGAVILAALLVGNGSTTAPTLARGASGAGAKNYGLTTASPLMASTYGSSLTTMPSPVTLASTTASGVVDFWFGMS